MAMTFQQLVSLRELVANGFNVSRTADALFTTQPGVSKMIRALERELGVEVFLRRGNRLVGLTEAGQEAWQLARRILQDASTLRQLGQGEGHGAPTRGTLRIGTTHIHARYRLLDVTERFLRAHPYVQIEYVVGTPAEIHASVRDGSLDIGLSTMPDSVPPGILALKAYDMKRCLVVPTGHPLLDVAEITLEELARWPWIVHNESLTSGAVVQRTFQAHGLQPRIVMRAMDVDVMKAYIARGIGIAVLQQMAMDGDACPRLRRIEVGNLFPSSAAMVIVRSDHLLKKFAFDFVRILIPRTKPKAIAEALNMAVMRP
ncbi:LysR substrate-binding domain-containing protein [Bordetella flabilis]|uniref:LysR substrate-binding domain-containing protein n=1 Tax=Bordetella flabilis TaxID=463014 RepID=UPI000A858DD8|nr:LysR substrate-binding domain-containing protein [Bordetella flabilis]